MKISAGNLEQALASIGKNPEARELMLETLRRIEPLVAVKDVETREQISGPIADAMFGEGEEFQKTLSDGTLISARYSSKISRDFVLAGESPDHVWEPQTTRTVLHLAQSAKNVVIGGAYIGDHAILIARMIAGSGQVHCFEPSRQNSELLRKNAVDNGLSNVLIHRVGLWSNSTEQLVLFGDDSHAYPKVAQTEDKDTFPTTSIDDYGAQRGIGTIDLILLDIEGAELPALKGAARYLAQPADSAPSVVFEVHGSYTDWSNGLENAEIVAFLKAHGYSVFGLRDYNGNVPMSGRKIEIVPPESAHLAGPPHGFNMVAVKRRDILDESIFAVVEGVSPKLLNHRDPKYHAPIS